MLAVTLAGLIAPAAACSSGSHAQAGADAGAPDATPFQADPAFTYVAKVKNVLVGLAPTDDEVTAVAADPGALRGLITTWMQLPAYRDKMKRFFELAFQQTQVSAVDYADQAYPKQIALNKFTTPLLMQNAEQSFALTMLELIDEGRPLTDSTTTTRLMMTTALKEMYAFLDVWQVDDAGKVTDRFKQANPALTITASTASGPIAIADSLDSTSANYMHWYNPDVATNDATVAGCTVDPVVYPVSAVTLHYLLTGSLDGHKNTTAGGLNCPPSGGTVTAPQLAAGDYTDWAMVTIRPPATGEASTRFYDLPALRTATELVLSVPRIGFFSTPAFFANWQTNLSNQMRVTLNQTLIVALGAQVDGTDDTMTPGSPPPGLDAAHASNAECFGCHQTLDPLRSIFSANYSWNYHNQADPTWTAQKGMFSFHGVVQPVSGVADFGQALAQHPLFAQAWVQKLCTYANSAPCLPSDPEMQRIVTTFQSSGYAWNTLVLELMSSPLTTNTSVTATTAANGEVVAVSRRDHLCAALNNRLGLSDICGLDAVTKKAQQAAVAQIAAGLPSDGYGRGSTAPVLPNDPSLFYRAGTENICATVATAVIDVAAAKQTAGVKYWSSAQPDAAIADFVATTMGLVPSDPRSAPATALLTAHFAAAMQQGASATDALRSTFIVACLSPSAVSIGL